uniref:Nuclear speckle splicing regulatory protein 1 n=1 Tax=Lygus hesperus TaxID=30085 RepID=A0A0A9XZF5_LYGHE
MASSKKQYGLQIPKKSNQPLLKTSVFGEDSDSEKSGGEDWLKKASKPDFSSSITKRQTKLEIEKALNEDATVFQYDEIYDEMDQKKQSAAKKDKDRKPKYVEKLLVAAEKRKMENERRYERVVQKEREAEGDEFKDKETFVTSAYKKKLEEFAKLDEEQKRQDMLEDIGDVTKQQDISGFYRHLYQETVADKKDDSQEKENLQKESEHSKKSASRQYRKRKDSNSSGDGDKDKDADSNFGSSSSSESSSEDSDGSGGNSSHSDTEDPKRIRLKKYSEPADVKHKSTPKVEEKAENKKDEKVVEPKKKEEVPKEPPVDIWKKRTVGPLFVAALERYMARKAARIGAAA